MLLKKISIASVMILFIGCAATNITSFTDPAYQNKPFKKVVVIALLSDLNWRNVIESKFSDYFATKGITAFKGMYIFPPTRNMSADQINETIKKYNIDASLYIQVSDAGTQDVYIPKTGSTSNTTGTVTVYGNYGTFEGTTTTTHYGGYTVSKPYAQFVINLFDTKEGQKAWTASAFTGGNAYANYYTVINSFVSKTVNRLINDGVFISYEK